ncbi:AAC(3) family N-acetyltransferase [Leptolyngbya sp. PCC 6406]|uniref:AAC(3) family N-acetyltransferase n=1 Tax=Leptolyngbya sp. PCC 6406 TaxID=1173264 RepID=UPI000907490C|nr:AAC(3) family N-acetyltransferase [Leptolyngbya sp. PCC 6406]
MVQSDVSKLGRPEGLRSKQEILEFYLNAFEIVLGSDGTLVVCTSFEDYGRYGTPFHLETSPSRLGAFSEYVRTQPGAIRSLHPLMSLTALGKHASEICSAPHFDAFGWDSPWGRLHRANAKLYTLGLSRHLEFGMTFVHYVEQCYGVPYQYNKVYAAPVFASGKQILGCFTMNVRYLDFGVCYDTLKVKEELLKSGFGKEDFIGRDAIFSTTSNHVFEVMLQKFREDRFFMLTQKPSFREGEIPLDGPTGEMKIIYDKGNEI